jgi:hypothetical protein
MDSLKRKKIMSKPAIVMWHLNKIISISTFDGIKLARLNWIKEIDHPIYEAGISFCDSYPYEEGCDVCLLESDPEEGFKPLIRMIGNIPCLVHKYDLEEYVKQEKEKG